MPDVADAFVPELGPALGLAGPTAAGKTAAALAVAEALAAVRPVEIVSVDSALVYRGMDIGTAKPSAAERACVPHHLIDVLDPVESYSAGRFVADALRTAAEIRARGSLPFFVGGTMLYFKALVDGIAAMPVADAAVRAALDAEAAERGWPALHAELAEVDPATAVRLAPGDSQRIQRALEVFRVSGRPLSSFHRKAGAALPARPLTLLSLEPDDRGWLHLRIAERFQAMLAAGFLDEVRALRARGDLGLDHPSMRCVGYRQAWEALDRGRVDEGALVAGGTAATRQLAKRQLTWLRSMPQRRRVAPDAAGASDEIVALARAWARSHEEGARSPR